jgi:hypothetical protein
LEEPEGGTTENLQYRDFRYHFTERCAPKDIRLRARLAEKAKKRYILAQKQKRGCGTDAIIC